MVNLLLAQDAPPADRGFLAWLNADDLFWFVLLVIFLTAIIGAVIRMRRRDKCLALFRDHHVTYLAVDGRTIWGDLTVTARGLELRFDAPHMTSRGLEKASTLIFDDEYAQCLALCRSIHGLSGDERAAREAQIRRTFRPGVVRRSLRWVRNVFNSIRDAFVKAFSLVIGRMGAGGAGAAGTAVSQRSGEVTALGTDVFGLVGNAYEPLLERHVGRPVVLELKNPDGAATPTTELPGYLVDYSDQFLAVFNVEHVVLDAVALPTDAAAQTAHYELRPVDGRVAVTCRGPELVVLRRMMRGAAHIDLAVVLLPGTSVQLRPPAGEGRAQLELEVVRQVDLVCPRSRARIRYGAQVAHRRARWSGTAPPVDIVDREPAPGPAPHAPPHQRAAGT